MRRVFQFFQWLFSAARRALSSSRAVLPLIRIIVALERFARGCFKSLQSPEVSTSSRPPESRSITPQQLIQGAQAPDRCMPSVLPTALPSHGQQQGALSPQNSAASDTTAPKPFTPEQLQRYEHRRPVYVIFQLR